jgi:hypothetical protein
MCVQPTKAPCGAPLPYEIYVLGSTDRETEVSFCVVGEDRINLTTVYRGHASFPRFLSKERARQEWTKLRSRGFELLERSKW